MSEKSDMVARLTMRNRHEREQARELLNGTAITAAKLIKSLADQIEALQAELRTERIKNQKQAERLAEMEAA